VNAITSYRIEWNESARKEIKHIERGVLRHILDAVMSLGVNPRPDGCRTLAGTSMTYRIRVVGYRVV
jgi:mRNA interferase RelE/StbE